MEMEAPFDGLLAIVSNTRVMLIQPFHESQVILICGKVIPGFLGYSWQCSNQLLQPLCESQDVFGNSWLSCSSYCGQIPGFPWKPRVTSWLSGLFLEYHSRLSEKAKNFLASLAFSRLFRVRKACLWLTEGKCWRSVLHAGLSITYWATPIVYLRAGVGGGGGGEVL